MIFHRASDEFTCSLQQEHSLTQEEVKKNKRDKLTSARYPSSLKIWNLKRSKFDLSNIPLIVINICWQILHHQMMEGIKRGILRGFLELDEKLRKIPEVFRRAMMLCPNSLPSVLNYDSPNNSVMLLTLWNLRVQKTCNYPNGIQALRV